MNAKSQCLLRWQQWGLSEQKIQELIHTSSVIQNQSYSLDEELGVTGKAFFSRGKHGVVYTGTIAGTSGPVKVGIKQLREHKNSSWLEHTDTCKCVTESSYFGSHDDIETNGIQQDHANIGMLRESNWLAQMNAIAVGPRLLKVIACLVRASVCGSHVYINGQQFIKHNSVCLSLLRQTEIC